MGISSIWSSKSCSDARVLQSLWDAEILASHIPQLSTSTFHIFMNEERQWMLGCCDWLQRTHSTIRPPNTHIHTHTKSEETSCYASAVHQGNQTASDSCWRNWEKERVGRARSSFWFSPLSPSLLLEPSDVIQVTYSSQTTPASPWQPIGWVLVWMGRSVPCGEGVWVEWGRSTSLVHWKKKKGSGEKSLLASLAAALNRAQMSLRADLTLCHTCRQCLHKADSERVCWWTYIINYCMIIHYRQWECNSYCFIIIAS